MDPLNLTCCGSRRTNFLLLRTFFISLLIAGSVGSEASAQERRNSSAGVRLSSAAIADVEMLIERERAWVGRPRADQLVPLVMFAEEFESYDSGSAAADLRKFHGELEQLRASPPEGENANLLLGGISVRPSFPNTRPH